MVFNHFALGGAVSAICFCAVLDANVALGDETRLTID
jgi:hypothetical protein